MKEHGYLEALCPLVQVLKTLDEDGVYVSRKVIHTVQIFSVLNRFSMPLLTLLTVSNRNIKMSLVKFLFLL